MEKSNERDEAKKLTSMLSHIIDIIFSIKQAFTELYNDCNCRKDCVKRGKNEINDETEIKK